MTLANKLTILRILLIPVYLVLVLLPIPYGSLWAALVFFFAAITDVLDGYIARRQHTVSDFGKVFDPIADKMMFLAALIPLTASGIVPSLMSIVFIGRELLISGLRIVAVSASGEVIAASWLGKAKTVSQDVAIIILLLQAAGIDFWLPVPLGGNSLYVALGFTLWSTVDYFIKNRGVFRGC
jgi:CDP-diacylglycerol--glycerol-3-phosphate 3-phosphatidyltransferase